VDVDAIVKDTYAQGFVKVRTAPRRVLSQQHVAGWQHAPVINAGKTQRCLRRSTIVPVFCITRTFESSWTVTSTYPRISRQLWWYILDENSNVL